MFAERERSKEQHTTQREEMSPDPATPTSEEALEAALFFSCPA
jgi:hypothetical protein